MADDDCDHQPCSQPRFHSALKELFPAIWEFAGEVAGEATNQDILGDRSVDVGNIILAWLVDVGITEPFGDFEDLTDEQRDLVGQQIRGALPLILFGSLLQRTNAICWPQDRRPDGVKIPDDTPEAPDGR